MNLFRKESNNDSEWSDLALNTYQGKVLSVKHELRIKITTSSFCNRNPQVIIPMRRRAKQEDFSAPHLETNASLHRTADIYGSSKSLTHLEGYFMVFLASVQ
jgi:hypothetical protein